MEKFTMTHKQTGKQHRLFWDHQQNVWNAFEVKDNGENKQPPLMFFNLKEVKQMFKNLKQL